MIGVQMATSRNAQIYCCGANKEVILCAGTVATPQLLMLSGVGPAEDLQELNIPVVKNMPAVGRNVIDVSLHVLAAFHRLQTLKFMTFTIYAPARLFWPDSIPYEAGLDV